MDVPFRPCLVGLVLFATAAAAFAEDATFVTTRSRQSLCEAIVEWSTQSGKSYCYSAWLPVTAPVVTAEPGDKVSLTDTLKGLGCRMSEQGGVAVIARDGDDAKVAELRTTLRAGKDEFARRMAAHALGRLTTPAAAAALAEGLADTNPAIQFQCLESLWAVEGDWNMRALPGRVSMLKVGQVKPEPLAKLAESASADKPRRAWRYSVSMLTRFSTLAGPLVASGAKDEDARVREIGGCPVPVEKDARAAVTPEARKAAIESSKDANPFTRLSAVRAMTRFGGSAALARLNELVDDSDELVRAEARQGMGWLGGVKEAERLAAMVAKERTVSREAPDAALVGLGLLLPPAAREIAIKTIVDLMQEPKACPWSAGRAAVLLNDPRLLPGLMKVFGQNRSGAPLRVDCFDALGQLGTKEITQMMARNWWEYENMARYEGGRMLRENLHQPAVHETLLDLTRAQGDSQEAAVFSLCNSRDPRAVAALAEVLTSGKGAYLGAGTSLGLIADPAATDALMAVASDAAHPGRFVAARALRMRDLAWQPKVKAMLVSLYGWREDGSVPPVSEQKPGTWVLRRYQRDFDDMTVSTLTYESAVAYDSTRGRVFHWGAHGKRYDSPQNGDTWIYDAADNQWTEGGRNENPPGTCMTREICYDANADRLLVRGASGGGHGWLFYREQRLRGGSPWAYDPAADRWTSMRSGPSGITLSHLIEFDSHNGTVLWAGRPTLPPAPKLPAGAPKPPPPPPQPVLIGRYDAWTNTWSVAASQPDGPMGGFNASAYDPQRGRMLYMRKGELWAYDAVTNAWTNLKPKNAPGRPEPLVYDSVNDRAVLVAESHGGATVHAYNPDTNEWSVLPAGAMRPDHSEWDAAFDERHNVVVVAGGKITACPGSPNCRELWTYRVADGAGPVGAPGPAIATATAEGIRVTWQPAVDKRVTGYRVSRADAGLPLGAKFTPLTEKSVTKPEFVDTTRLPAGQPAIYAIESVTAAGERSAGRSMARTVPPVVIGVVAMWSADKKARVTWDKSAAGDVVGYNVYRSAVRPGPLYSDNPFAGGFSEFVKVNADPVKDCQFLDSAAAEDKLPDGQPLPAGWALAPRAYRVCAVNSLGLESGPGPWSVTLPRTVQRIEAQRRDDGSVVVRWTKDPSPDVVGYAIYRQDNWANRWATRVNAAPVTEATFIDPADGVPYGAQPMGERQRYWVVAVDRFGQEGPSGTGAWSFNR